MDIKSKLNGVVKQKGRPTLVGGAEGQKYVAGKFLDNLRASGGFHDHDYFQPDTYQSEEEEKKKQEKQSPFQRALKDAPFIYKAPQEQEEEQTHTSLISSKKERSLEEVLGNEGLAEQEQEEAPESDNLQDLIEMSKQDAPREHPGFMTDLPAEASEPRVLDDLSTAGRHEIVEMEEETDKPVEEQEAPATIEPAGCKNEAVALPQPQMYWSGPQALTEEPGPREKSEPDESATDDVELPQPQMYWSGPQAITEETTVELSNNEPHAPDEKKAKVSGVELPQPQMHWSGPQAIIDDSAETTEGSEEKSTQAKREITDEGFVLDQRVIVKAYGLETGVEDELDEETESEDEDELIDLMLDAVSSDEYDYQDNDFDLLGHLETLRPISLNDANPIVIRPGKTNIMDIPELGPVKSSRGTVVMLVHKGGRKFKPHYNACGMLNEVEVSDGFRFMKNSAGEWQMIAADGSSLCDKHIESIAFDRSGNLWYRTDDGDQVTYNVDGSVS